MPPDNVNYFPIDGSGARAAMTCERGILAWCGEESDYPDPLAMQMVDVDGREL